MGTSTVGKDSWFTSYTAISAKASEILVEDRKRKSTTKEKIRRKKTKGQITLFSLGLTIQDMTMA